VVPSFRMFRLFRLLRKLSHGAKFGGTWQCLTMFRMFRLFRLLRKLSHGAKFWRHVAVAGCSDCSGFCTTFSRGTVWRYVAVSRCSGCSGGSGFYANFLTSQNSETCGSLTSSTYEKDHDFFAREPVDGIREHAQHPADQHLVVVEDVPEELHRYGGWEVEPLKRRKRFSRHPLYQRPRTDARPRRPSLDTRVLHGRYLLLALRFKDMTWSRFSAFLFSYSNYS
jgi:hypothetical protein